MSGPPETFVPISDVWNGSTDALFADQSQSILDNLVALLGRNSAWHWTQNAVIRNTSGPIRGPLRDAPLAVCDATSVAFADFVHTHLPKCYDSAEDGTARFYRAFRL